MASSGTAGRVLLADAQPATRGALGNALTRAGFEVATAPSGSEALTRLEWECPDVIVSCAKVQDMDGYELFTRVRRDPTTIETHASFRLSQTDRAQVAHLPRIIARSVDQLLLSIAAGIDEGGSRAVPAHPTH